MMPGDWLAAIGMTIVIGALVIGHLRAVRAQRELDRRFGHPVRKSRATGDARVTEHTWSSR